MVNSLASQSNYEIWQIAHPLDFARHHYSPPRLKEQFAEAKTKGPSKAIEMLMEADVRASLMSGALSAFGFCTSPDLSDGPMAIPQSIFGADAVTVDWEKSVIDGLGRRFEAVRVCRLITAANENPAEAVPSHQPGKRGAKGYTAIFEEAYKSLELEHPDFADWVREKQVLEIQGKASATHPGRFRGGSPGRSTIYRFLSDRHR